MRRERGVGEMLIVYALGAVALGALIWWGVSSIEGRGYDRGMAECARKAQEQRDKETKAGAGASTKLEQANEKSKVVYRTITRSVDRIVSRPVYVAACLDDEGLRIANEALSGRISETKDRALQ